MKTSLLFSKLAFIVLTIFLSNQVQATKKDSFVLNNKKIEFHYETLTDGLNLPWSLDFLPDGGIIISEKSGNLRIWKDGKLSAPIKHNLKPFVRSQGGFLDVKLHPEFKKNRQLFLAYSSGNLKNNATRLIKATLNNNELTNIETLFTSTPNKSMPLHYGGRIALLPDNTLLLSSGDGYSYKDQAQTLDNSLGKIIRIDFNGNVPKDNPFIDNKNANNEVYSYGHRNPQGLIFDPVRSIIIAHEHGPKGGDEINFIEAGKNYGWPAITYGIDYSGAIISPHTHKEGMEQPILYWTPSIAPSGLAVYRGELFKELEGSLLVGALAGQELRIVQLDGKKVVNQISLFKDKGIRIRDVRVSPDGAIYLLTDSHKGELIKITR